MTLQHFHPSIREWFQAELGAPTPTQSQGWAAIAARDHTLIAAPTGSGKTLAAFLVALDRLLRQGETLGDRCQVLYISPLKALGNDIQKNLELPLQQLRAAHPELPQVQVAVRSGDTPAHQRQAMLRRAPHILVTTPESLYILLTSQKGQTLLADVDTVIIDEIHAMLGDKRGSHLALSLERLARLCSTGPQGAEPQRIGLSATQRPMAAVADFLVGTGRSCRCVDAGHLRQLDLALEVPGSDLETVCSTEVWEDIYGRMVAQIEAHRSTIVFTNTRKLAERVAARLSEQLGAEHVTSHHGSLSKERRLDAEQRLTSGSLRALVATASLELGIDVGDVDLVIQVGSTWSIATFLQRVGRAGHGIGRIPKGRIFPLTRDDLVCATALLQAVQEGELDRTPQPGAPLDILTQQIVAACVAGDQDTEELYTTFRRAWPYRELSRADFEACIGLHSSGRYALLHRDGVQGRLRATRRARIPAVSGGGAIPDVADYKVVQEPEGTHVGSVHEDFAIESSIGDIFQLGNTSWQVVQVNSGVMRVADAKGTPPSLPFWIAEAPGRSAELAAAVSRVRAGAGDRDFLAAIEGLPESAAAQVHAYISAAEEHLGAVPTRECIVLERFFDETGGMQMVMHLPFGSRINRAFGLALRKKFCRGFGFELQAAANDEALVLSLGPMHSFELEEVFSYLHPERVRETLTQALLPAPMFATRWRWNVSRALVVPRTNGGKRVPAPLLRMRADDALAEAFPEALACGETLPPGDLPVPMEHPLVRQTVEDCMYEAMDLDGLVAVLRGIRSGAIRTHCIDTAEPSPLAMGVLSAGPFAFLDDAPLEERRTQAVLSGRGLDRRSSHELGSLDPAAVAQVREEAWPRAREAEEVHEALLWMGYVTSAEAAASGWQAWLESLGAAGRVYREGERWFATEASTEPAIVLAGRMEALGPVASDDPLMLTLQAQGKVLRVQLEGEEMWCDRRLLARIQRYTLDKLRAAIQPVDLATYLRFLARWQHFAPGSRLEGPAGVRAVVEKLAGLELPAVAWERDVLPARVQGYQKSWLDQWTLGGELCWGRLWSEGRGALRSTPVALFPRAELRLFLGLAGALPPQRLSGPAETILQLLRARGACFPQELAEDSGLLPSYFEAGISELVGLGLIHADSFAALRQFFRAPSKRRQPVWAMGRWTLLRPMDTETTDTAAEAPDEAQVEALCRIYLRRYGLVTRRVLARERCPLPWRLLLRGFRNLELRGDVRGGRFVIGCDGEHFALEEAIPALRKCRTLEQEGLEVAAADPLNLSGILTPAERVSPQQRTRVHVL